MYENKFRRVNGEKKRESLLKLIFYADIMHVVK